MGFVMEKPWPAQNSNSVTGQGQIKQVVPPNHKVIAHVSPRRITEFVRWRPFYDPFQHPQEGGSSQLLFGA